MPKQLAHMTYKYGIGFFACLIAMTTTVYAQSSEMWAADELLAQASLPLSAGKTNVQSAQLSCDAQKWSLHVNLDEAAALPETDVTILVDRSKFTTKAVSKENILGIRVPHEALEALKRGIKMSVVLSEETDAPIGTINFPLRGSRIAITAIEDRCSQRDMSGYRAITFTPYSSYAALAEDLRKKDIESFKTATFSRPVLTVAMAEFGEGRRTLFTRLCGSSWYYGRSGCNITGFTQTNQQTTGSIEGWTINYDSENVSLHVLEEDDSQGWPDLVALPMRTTGKGVIWGWDNGHYTIKGELLDENDDGLPVFAAE